MCILAASMLEIMLAERPKIPGREVITASEEIVWADKGGIATSKGRDTFRAGDDFKCLLILYLILKYKTITKMNLNLMMFIRNIYLKYIWNKTWGIYNKSSWVWVSRDLLNSIIS